MILKLCLFVLLTFNQVSGFNIPPPSSSIGQSFAAQTGFQFSPLAPVLSPDTSDPGSSISNPFSGTDFSPQITNPVGDESQDEATPDAPTPTTGGVGDPPSVFDTVKIGSKVNLAVTRRSVEKQIRSVSGRLTTLENHFIEKGVLVKDNSTTFGTGLSLTNRVTSAKERAEKLQKAIDNYKLALSGGGGSDTSGGNSGLGSVNGDGTTGVDGSQGSVSGGDGTGSSDGGDETPVEAPYTEGEDARFTDRIWVGFIDDSQPDEISGMAYSHKHNDIIYVVNDHQYDDDVYVINATNGKYLNKFDVKYANNYDWEDLAVAPCERGSTRSCLYIGDIGETSTAFIYVAPEPDDPVHDTSVTMEQRYPIPYKEESMETMLVTPEADIYVITEEKNAVLVNVKSGQIIEDCAYFWTEYYGPTGGAVSADGTMVLIKVEEYVYYYYLGENNLEDVVCNNRRQHLLEYSAEYDGQSITFSPDGLSYYTCIEYDYSPLYKYDRKRVA